MTLLHVSSSSSQGPHSKILMTGGRGVRQRFIFYTQKNHNSNNLPTPKNYYFFSIPPNKSLSPFFAPQKIPSVFLHNLKKSRRLSQTQKNHFCQNFRPEKHHSDLPIINICEWGPWAFVFCCFFCFFNLIHFCLYRWCRVVYKVLDSVIIKYYMPIHWCNGE